MYKKLLPLIAVFILSLNTSFSQQEKGIYGIENWLDIWTNFVPSNTEYKTPTQILSGTITKDTKLLKRETYLLVGDVFVTDSITLTIEPGTVILGDYKTKGSLTISKNSKIIADGTQTDPIIFSSNRTLKKRGDWGGIFILGDAPVNKVGEDLELAYGLEASSPKILSYGGTNTESNSGILRYVRIEYAGKRTKGNGYFNALTLAAVGNKTILENIMVTYCEGSSFYVEGGNVNMYQLVSFRSRQSDFIFNYGTQASISNAIAIKSPYFVAAGGASSLYVASYNTKDEIDTTKSKTNLEAQNITILNISDDLDQAIKVGLVSEALYVNNETSFTIKKSVISGFNPAVILNADLAINSDNLSKMRFSNMYFNNCKGNIFTEGVANNEDLENWYGNSSFQNVYSKGSNVETFIEAEDLNNPDFRLRINKIIASNRPEDDE